MINSSTSFKTLSKLLGGNVYSHRQDRAWQFSEVDCLLNNPFIKQNKLRFISYTNNMTERDAEIEVVLY